MANITFAWMVECIRPYLAINETTILRSLNEYTHLLETFDCKNNHHHDPSKEPSLAVRAYNGVYNSLPSIWETPPQAPLAVGWGTADHVDSYQGVMAWAGSKQRFPGECETEVVVENTFPWNYAHGEKMVAKKLNKLGKTNEEIHPVARFRREKLDREGKTDKGGLQGWEKRKNPRGEGYEWHKNVLVHKDDLVYEDVLVLKEYVIKKSGPGVGDFGNVERLVAERVDQAKEFLEDTDIGNGKLANFVSDKRRR